MRHTRITEIPDEFMPVEDSDRQTKEFRFELITPMFGGDAESWKLDRKSPVRGQSVKGQLRFWWRTMQSETDHRALLYKENAIWGGKFSSGENGEEERQKSPVSLSVIDYEIPNSSLIQAEMENKYAVKGNIIPKYVLFPITDKVKKNEEIYFIKEMSFTLKISYQRKDESEVLDTLRLWTLFGGVGARTRRGCGSLYCEELLSDIQDQQALLNFVNSKAGATASLAYPTLGNAKLFLQSQRNEPAQEWRSLLESYGKYRQNRRPGTGNRPGRSYWPEPDAIRRIKEQWGRHEPKHPDGNWFPRAAFGLPIQFKFTGDNRDPDSELKSTSGERWPSPMILKAVQLPGGSYRCMLVLNQQFPGKLKLDDKVLDNSASPENYSGKVMIDKDGMQLEGRSVYKALADYLGLEEQQ